MNQEISDIKAEISLRFKRARESLGFTQADLAAKIGVSGQTVKDYEGGKSIPGGAAIAGLVWVGINANWLLTGEGPMRTGEPAFPPILPLPVYGGGIEGFPEVGAEDVLAAMEAVETYLQEKGITLTPAKKVALVRLLCEYSADQDREETREKGLIINMATMQRLVKLAS